jgi:AcrR family transcriptional regulator
MDSRRERKKQQTRRLLAETAIRLFAEQGYGQTTVAQIASAADVATKTFFNHFPSKEDVFFAENLQYGSMIPLEVIASRRPGETVAELLTRAYDTAIDDYLAADAGMTDPALMETYIHLVMTVPALQAKALHMVFQIQQEVAAALLKVYPDELDPISAAAIVGSLVGATQAATLASLARGETEAQFWESMRRGIDIALHGLQKY